MKLSMLRTSISVPMEEKMSLSAASVLAPSASKPTVSASLEADTAVTSVNVSTARIDRQSSLPKVSFLD